MGTIKFEIDLPEFEKELSINVTIHRDGEVVYTTTSYPSASNICLNARRPIRPKPLIATLTAILVSS